MVGQEAEQPSPTSNGPPRATSQHSSPPSPGQQIPIQSQSHPSPVHNASTNSTDSFYPDSTYSSLEAGPSPPVLIRPEQTSPKLQRDVSPGHSKLQRDQSPGHSKLQRDVSPGNSCDNSPRPSRDNSPLLPRGKENLRSTSSAPSHYIQYDPRQQFLSPIGATENHDTSSGEIKKKKNKKMRAAGKAMKHLESVFSWVHSTNSVGSQSSFNDSSLPSSLHSSPSSSITSVEDILQRAYSSSTVKSHHSNLTLLQQVMLDGGEITVRINHQHPLDPSISDLDCGHDDGNHGNQDGNHGNHDGNHGSYRERSLSLGQDLILPAVTIKNQYGEEGKKKTPPTVRGDLLAVPGEEGKRKRRRSSNARRKSIEMLNMLSNKMLPNSNAKSREQDFHKLFKSLPDGETLIQDFSCALLRDILVQGRLYISQNWFCFYANILGWETLLTIEVKKIAGIKKEKTALVINNAISISTHDEKYFFSSFMSRDSAYAHMMRVWLPASDPSVAIPSVDLSSVGDDDKMSSDGYMSEDDELQPSYPPLRTLRQPQPSTASSSSKSHKRSNSVGARPATRPLSVMGRVPPEHSTRGGGENVSFSQEDETCVCISHYAHEHFNQDFDMNIEKMYKLLFNDDSSVQSKMKDLQKMTEYEVTSWTDSNEGANERTLNYMIPLNANLGPKFAEVVEKQVLTTNSVAAKCYIVNCEVNNPNVPYGDKFFIMKRYCLTRCSDNVCRLRMTSEVQYRKGVWGMVKSIIEKNSREGISEYCDDLCTCLTEESAGPGVKVRKSVPGSSRASSSRVTRAVSQEQPARSTSATQFVSNNYIAMILIMMAVLLMLNLILVYRLSSFTSQSCPLELLNSMPHSEEGKSEWIKILAKQQDLHKKEIERWQEVLRWISKLVSEVHVSLDKLQKSSIYITPPNTEL